jgi:cation diffusion facilitator family transporter
MHDDKATAQNESNSGVSELNTEQHDQAHSAEHDHHDHPHEDGNGHNHDHTDEQDHAHVDGQHADEHDHDHEDGQHADEHDHDHSDGHGHSHGPGEDHDHHHGPGIIGWFQTVFHWHGHSEQQKNLAADQALLDNKQGILVLWISLAALLLTSLMQIVVVAFSGSVALLADTMHNIGDGLNSIPLLIALYLARRLATRRYTYGFGKAEDVAGVFIVISIAISAAIVFSESIQKFINQEPMTNLGWVAVAAVIGFIGNEFVAVIEIRTGKKIGSAAMVTDGLHARTDGLTSLAVLVAAIGTWLGFPILDPIIGILIGIAILFITRDAIVAMWYRLMDAIEPTYMDQAEGIINSQDEVKELRRLRMRWVGHRLHTEAIIAVHPDLSTIQSHEIAEKIRHDLFHQFPTMSDVMIHVDPYALEKETEAYHRLTQSHDPIPELLSG